MFILIKTHWNWNLKCNRIFYLFRESKKKKSSILLISSKWNETCQSLLYVLMYFLCSTLDLQGKHIWGPCSKSSGVIIQRQIFKNMWLSWMVVDISKIVSIYLDSSACWAVFSGWRFLFGLNRQVVSILHFSLGKKKYKRFSKEIIRKWNLEEYLILKKYSCLLQSGCYWISCFTTYSLTVLQNGLGVFLGS